MPLTSAAASLDQDGGEEPEMTGLYINGSNNSPHLRIPAVNSLSQSLLFIHL